MAKFALPCFYFILTCEVLIDIENKFGRNYVDVHFWTKEKSGVLKMALQKLRCDCMHVKPKSLS